MICNNKLIKLNRMKDLESKLAERDAMIRVLQKHTYDKDSSSSSGMGSYPAVHSSHSSTSADHTGLTGTPELGRYCSNVTNAIDASALSHRSFTYVISEQCAGWDQWIRQYWNILRRY